jgi:integrase/recombinase XerC
MKSSELKIRSNAIEQLRPVALTSLLLGTGMRVGAAHKLLWNQIDFKAGKICRVREKGSKVKDIFFIGGEESRSLKALSLLQRLTCGLPNDKVFPVNSRTMHRWVERVCIEAGIIEHGHPHKLRHTMLINLLEQCRDLRFVAQVAGHSRVETTMRYTQRTEEDLAQKMRSFKL